MENQDKAAIEQTLNSYFKSLNESDAKTAVASYTTDGVFIAAGAPTAIGTAQLVTAYEYLFNAIELNVKVNIDEVIIKDDISFVRTHSNATTLIRATRQTIIGENREFFLLRKEQGEWKNCTSL